MTSTLPRGYWRVGSDRVLPLDRPRLIGILNMTPDSFSDGGAYPTLDDAVRAAVQMRSDGASVIDVGGESTRPGSHAVDAQEQIRRTHPVIELMRREFDADQLLISIDTTCSEVARAALDAGADIINDISAGRDDPDMLPLAAARGCGVILMHRRALPARDVFSHQYKDEPDYGGDVVVAVRQFLHERVDAAHFAGVAADAIVVDPGLGFGKSVKQNYELAGRIHEVGVLNHHVLSAASRKSFIGAAMNEPTPSRRVAGSLAFSVAHWMLGVRLFRVHDVAAHRQALDVAAALAPVKTLSETTAPAVL